MEDQLRLHRVLWNPSANSGSTRKVFATCGGRALDKNRGGQKSETTLPRARTRMTPDKSINQAKSSSAIRSSGGEHAEKSAESTVEGENPMFEIKRPKKGSTTHIRSMSGTVEFSESPVKWSTRKDAQDASKMVDAELPREQTEHVGGADAKSKCRAAGRAASVSHRCRRYSREWLTWGNIVAKGLRGNCSSGNTIANE